MTQLSVFTGGWRVLPLEMVSRVMLLWFQVFSTVLRCVSGDHRVFDNQSSSVWLFWLVPEDVRYITIIVVIIVVGRCYRRVLVMTRTSVVSSLNVTAAQSSKTKVIKMYALIIISRMI